MPDRKAPIKSAAYQRYVVMKGDTLSAISRRYGIAVLALKRINKLKSDHLQAGQVLYLPADKKSAFTKPTSIKPVPRSYWTKYRVKGNITAMGKVNKITIHHTDDFAGFDKTTDLKYLQIIENHHRNTNKWACIGYHYIIGRDGKIYEGRPLSYQGAHVKASNPNNIGIAMIGNFDKALPKNAQINALERLLNSLRKKYKLPAHQVYGHRHLDQTECPGKYLKKWIETYRRRLYGSRLQFLCRMRKA